MSPPDKRNDQSALPGWFTLASRWFSVSSMILVVVVPIVLVIVLLAFLYLAPLGS